MCSPFERDDCIVLFTDGLYEVDSAEGEEFGLDALLSSFRRHVNLPAQRLFDALLSDVEQYSSRPDFEDDVCIVAVERRSRKNACGDRMATRQLGLGGGESTPRSMLMTLQARLRLPAKFGKKG